MKSSVTKVYTHIALVLFLMSFAAVSVVQAADADSTTKVASKKAKAAPAAPERYTAKKKIVVSDWGKNGAQKKNSLGKAQAQAEAQARTQSKVQSRMPTSLSTGVSDSQKSLEIRGQSRNLSMLLVLKNRHENIDFVKPRESYREEISQTGF